MTKLITSWGLIAAGLLILIAIAVLFGSFVLDNFKSRQDGVLNASLFQVPTFSGYSIKPKGDDASRGFFTGTWAFLIGHVGVALVLIAVGLHLRYLHLQDTGAKGLMQMEQDREMSRDSPSRYL